MKDLNTIEIYWSTSCLNMYITETLDFFKYIMKSIDDPNLNIDKNKLNFSIVESLNNKFKKQSDLIDEYTPFHKKMENEFLNYKNWDENSIISLSNFSCRFEFSYEELNTFYLILSCFERRFEKINSPVNSKPNYIVHEYVSKLKKELQNRLGIALLNSY